MKKHPILLITAGMLLASSCFGQSFTSGSTGAYGPINITENTTLTTPEDGIFHATTINIDGNRTLTFTRNDHNTPIYLLATGDITINGDINVSGSNGTNLAGGLGGPGGFDGGSPGSVGTPPGDGNGPGAGRGGAGGWPSDAAAAGAATYSQNIDYISTQEGSPYGSPLLIPMMAGSGGGGTSGTPGSGGGGGGGAIVIASTTQITLGTSSSDIFADGGYGSNNISSGNGGSGGAIRLVAPRIVASGARLYARGNDYGGDGRIRVDTLDRSSLNISTDPNYATSVGSMMVVFPSPLPKLDIVSAAGTGIAEGADPVFVNLNFGTDPNQSVTVQARDFNSVVPVTIVLTPDHGEAVRYEAEIDNVTSNPATVEVDVVFPVNVTTNVHAWTR